MNTRRGSYTLVLTRGTEPPMLVPCDAEGRVALMVLAPERRRRLVDLSNDPATVEVIRPYQPGDDDPFPCSPLESDG